MPDSFSDPTEHSLRLAERSCAARGAKLTELRRQVLGLVLDSPRPAAAYDLLDALRARHKGAAPPTVYRALDFLLAQGLIHKLERLSAYVGCAHGPDHAGCAHDGPRHAAQFLTCERCGRTAELGDAAIERALRHAAERLGFALRGAVVEAGGLCAGCAALPAPA